MFNEIKVQYENVLNKSGFKCKLKYVKINNNNNNNNDNYFKKFKLFFEI